MKEKNKEMKRKMEREYKKNVYEMKEIIDLKKMFDESKENKSQIELEIRTIDVKK
jgi:hypothetical protein